MRMKARERKFRLRCKGLLDEFINNYYIYVILHISFFNIFKYYTINNFFYYLKQQERDINKIFFDLNISNNLIAAALHRVLIS
jgi:hypothetical protein